MPDYLTPYDLAADDYANGEYDLYIGRITGPDGTGYDVEVHPTKSGTVLAIAPGGIEIEVDVSGRTQRPGESVDDAFLRIATEHLKEGPMTYIPHPGDLARDVDGELWFVYADATDPTDLYAITTPYKHHADGTPIDTVTGKWGPLTLEHRPEEDPEEVIR